MAFSYDFRPLETREALRSFLALDEASFEAVLAFDPARFDGASETGDSCSVSVIELPLFFRHDIPKKNPTRGYRTVWEPAMGLKSVYKLLARRLDSFFHLRLDGYPHDSVYGFRTGRNIRENASVHVGHKLLLATDITDFFPSISTARIETLFRGLGLTQETSSVLSRFVTIGGRLPLGLPTSPTISNAITLPIDIALQSLANEGRATYSRYADDLSFSGNDGLPDIGQVSRILAAHDFQIADSKTRRSKIGQAHYVTGLSISDPAGPHVPRKMKRALRQELHYARKFGLEEHLEHLGGADDRTAQMQINRLDGLVKFVSHHEPTQATAWKVVWGEILRESGQRASFAPKNQHRTGFHILVDEAEYLRNGKKVLAIGMAVSQHLSEMVVESQRIFSAATSDVWAAGKPQVIRKRGLHFADAHPDLRLAYVEALRAMPFEGYVAFAEYDGPSDYERTYIRLLEATLPRRLMAAESQSAEFYFEKNSKVSEKAVEACVWRAYSELRKRNDRHPERIGIAFVTKPNLMIPAPDFLLGVMGRYLQSEPAGDGEPTPRDHLMFERLRDKYRVILDVSNGVEYSRRRPIERWTAD